MRAHMLYDQALLDRLLGDLIPSGAVLLPHKVLTSFMQLPLLCIHHS